MGRRLIDLAKTVGAQAYRSPANDIGDDLPTNTIMRRNNRELGQNHVPGRTSPTRLEKPQSENRF